MIPYLSPCRRCNPFPSSADGSLFSLLLPPPLPYHSSTLTRHRAFRPMILRQVEVAATSGTPPFFLSLPNSNAKPFKWNLLFRYNVSSWLLPFASPSSVPPHHFRVTFPVAIATVASVATAAVAATVAAAVTGTAD